MSPTIALKCRLKARPDNDQQSMAIESTAGASTATSSPTSWCHRGLAPPPAFPSPSTKIPMTLTSSRLTASTPPPSLPPPTNSLKNHHREVSPLQLQRVINDDEEAAEGVQLLLGIANIVSKEVADSGCKNEESFFNENSTSGTTAFMTPPSRPRRVGLLDHDHVSDSEIENDDGVSGWSRARSVSIDHSPVQRVAIGGHVFPHTLNHGFSQGHGHGPKGLQQRGLLPSTTYTYPLPTMISPIDRSTSYGVTKRLIRPTRKGADASAAGGACSSNLKFVPHKARKEQIKFPKLPQLTVTPTCTVREYTRKAVEIADQKGTRITTIGRKKFSWKNYPELEAFLVANREEYLRYSALNYTVQQKHYNNRLTEQLLELASQHGYVFDNTEFNFVTVRDRIRCFYKSYVQSSKKRGIVLGYAARKAGILTSADLQKSARQEATIFTPEE